MPKFVQTSNSIYAIVSFPGSEIVFNIGWIASIAAAGNHDDGRPELAKSRTAAATASTQSNYRALYDAGSSTT